MKPQINKWTAVIIGILFAGLIIVPSVRNDVGLARNPQNYMSQGWQEATQYLRNHLTPEQETEYYKAHNEGEELNISYVLAWWDYGYWIVRDAHMPVICSPGGGKRTLAANLLLSDNVTEAIQQLKLLNIKYIVIDSQTAVEEFYSVVQYAGLDLKEYYDIQDGEIFKTTGYYATLLARLYYLNFVDGIKLAFQSSNEVLVGNDYIPEVKVFEVQ
jgi:asparagine N-glycosylation enzyme membrane subunit Stt3